MIPDNKTALRVLIVEDDADCAESLATLLRFYGHVVEVAATGLEAIAIAETGRPDVALVDIGLPGMNGYELVQHFRRPRPSKTPLLIAVTGYGRAVDRQRCLDTGFDFYLVKPADPDELRIVLEKFSAVIGQEPHPLGLSPVGTRLS